MPAQKAREGYFFVHAEGMILAQYYYPYATIALCDCIQCDAAKLKI